MPRNKEEFLAILAEVSAQSPAVAQRRPALLLITELIDRTEAGGILDAIIQSAGYLNSISDCGSESIALIYKNGWCLGFEGEGGELVIVIAFIESIRRRKTGLEIRLEDGEVIYLRFHGRWAPVHD